MSGKDTVFYPKTSINCRGNLLSLEHPVVMGILNTTPDSFFAKSRVSSSENAIKQAEQMLADGAQIIDVGGYSSRPGAQHIDEKEEIARVIEIITDLSKSFPDVVISIDTFRSKVAQRAIDAGATIINDISAGNIDPEIMRLAAKFQVPYIMMHMQGTPQNMQEKPYYSSVIKDIMLLVSEKIAYCKKIGIKDLILDPGFGFGKSLEHNYQLLNGLDEFHIFNLPVLAGVSRKSLINKVAGTSPASAGNATTAFHILLLQQGVKILRSHDVKEAVEAIKIFNFATSDGANPY